MADIQEFNQKVRVSIGALVFSAAALMSASFIFYDLNTLGDRMDKRHQRHEEVLEKYDEQFEEIEERLTEIEKELNL